MKPSTKAMTTTTPNSGQRATSHTDLSHPLLRSALGTERRLLLAATHPVWHLTGTLAARKQLKYLALWW